MGETLGNVIWFFCGGFAMAVGYMIAGIATMATIIGIPAGFQGIKIGFYAAWPFGQVLVQREVGCLGVIGNVIWFILGGWALALGHLILGLLFVILIVTYPFALIHFRMARMCLAPYGLVAQVREYP